MTQLRVFSDLHNEFQVFDMPITAADAERTLILAGDIDAAQNAFRNVNWINEIASFFKHVIYICGNHEFYHGDHNEMIQFYKNTTWKQNVHFLDHESIELDGIAFWAGTTWTPIKGGVDWGMMQRIRRGMNDFRLIRKTEPLKTTQRIGENFDPFDMVEIFTENKPKLFAAIEKARGENKKIVVVTHHAPTSGSIGRDYRGHDLNEAYCMYIDKEVQDNGPDLWIHGHIHAFNHYMVGNTRVVANPRGYAGYGEVTGFNPNFVIDV